MKFYLVHNAWPYIESEKSKKIAFTFSHIIFLIFTVAIGLQQIEIKIKFKYNLKRRIFFDWLKLAVNISFRLASVKRLCLKV